MRRLLLHPRGRLKPKSEEETVTGDNTDRLAWLRKVIADGDAELARDMLKVFA